MRSLNFCSNEEVCIFRAYIEVEYALRIVNKPIGIAKYQLTKELPEDLKNEMPDVNELKKKIKDKNLTLSLK